MRVAVMCIGNELLMDEGVGPACARYMAARYAFPDGDVDVLDRACMGMAIMTDLREHDFVLALDAVDVPGAEPGSLFSFAPEDVAPTPAGMTSLHDVRFADVLASAELLGIHCAGHCFGIQVENMSPSEFVCALTPRVAAALPLLAQAAVRYLRDKLHVAAVDLLAEGDPRRAGLEVPGARDFSRAGRRAAGAAGRACGTGAAGAAGHASGSGVRGVEAAGEACADGEASDRRFEPGMRAVPEVPMPAVYGEPDSGVMARYLAAGLAAVGAGGGYGSAADDGRARVAVELPAGCAVDGLVARFGLEPVALAAGVGEVDALEATESAERACFWAWVAPQTTDYDCDALIGACRDLVRADRTGACAGNADAEGR